MTARLFPTVLASTGAILSISAAAQTPADPASQREPVLNEVIVTAQRQSERLQDVPVSVTAVSSDTLRERGITSINQLSLAAPSFQVNSGDNNLTIRGIGTLAFQQTLESSVAVAQDEVNLVNQVLASPAGALFDIERVEVLNGPQGLLFGKNASAGLVNIVTRPPQLGEWSGDVQLEGALRPDSPDTSQGVLFQGTLNAPVTSDSALRVNLNYSKQDPITAFRGSGSGDFGLDQWGIRAKYLAELRDNLSLYIIADYQSESGIGSFFERTYRSLAPTAGALPLIRALGIEPSPDNLLLGGNGRFFREVERGGAQATLAYLTAGGYEISNIAAWKTATRDQSFDTDLVNENGADVNESYTDYSQFTNELRVALPAGRRLSGQFGLFFYDATTDVQAALYGNSLRSAASVRGFPFCVGATSIGTGPGQCRRSNLAFLGQDRDYTLDSQSLAGFGQFTYEITDGLKAIAGARLTRDTLDFRSAQHQGFYFVTLGVPLRTTAETSNTDFSYRAGLQYNLNPDVMVYATYARGYKGPGFADNVAAVGVSPVVEPETNQNVELGLRSTLADKRVTLNLTAVQSEFRNLQVSSFNPTLGSAVVQNAAAATSRGLEATVGLRPTPGLLFNVGATLLDSEYDDFPGAQCWPGQSDPSCNITPASARQFNAAGFDTPGAPGLSATAQVRYDWVLGNGVGAFVDANLLHRSSIWYTNNRTPGTQLGTTDVFGLTFGLRSDAGWSLDVFCRNCTNEIVPTAIGLDPAESNAGRIGLQQQYGFQSVRQYGVTAGYRF